MKHLHPFPARMAPELALDAMKGLPIGASILDPMAGSGTALRHASLAGYKAVGFDLDPLAVLIASVSSREIDTEALEYMGEELIERASGVRAEDVTLPWMDDSQETSQFVKYWFGHMQRAALRKIAYALHELESSATGNEKHCVAALKIALSRIIITKERGASLARDVSHSRPHKVQEASSYDVFGELRRSIDRVIDFLERDCLIENATAKRGDARRLRALRDHTFDLVLTSPPYLNAIDYLRGHKLSLVWLGYTVEKLRNIRGSSIGSEHSLQNSMDPQVAEVTSVMVDLADLPPDRRGVVSRYARDVLKIVAEIRRVLKSTGKAVIVVGDCCVKSVFVSNSDGIKQAAKLRGLHLVSQTTRELPPNSRYLPIASSSALGNRLRTENVITFCAA